ncbi:hypothetical protein [Pseudomonas sp.]|uniref:hypothetical protein n=1 Tax=Pseudomonas sp. TaxID=306 RepID=UPI0032647FC6
MKLTGEDVASSVRDAFKEELKKGLSKRHELGKYFMGVSTGTLGLFATLLKLAESNSVIDKLSVACFGVLLVSILISLYMSIPAVVHITPVLNIYEEYNRIVRSTIQLMSFWTLFWIIGFVLGAFKLFH